VDPEALARDLLELERLMAEDPAAAEDAIAGRRSPGRADPAEA
jgi:hypothetical protein